MLKNRFLSVFITRVFSTSNRKGWQIELIFGLLSISVLASTGIAGTLQQDFESPPRSARPYVWWPWMGSNVTSEGITRDLEMMKAFGIGGATIFNVTSSVEYGPMPMRNSMTPQVTYRSPAWWALLLHASQESRRLGLELGMQNCVGYSASGGPWITPDKSMQKLVWSKTKIAGPAKFSQILAQPPAHPDYPYYRDVAVLAVPDGTIASVASVMDLTSRMSGNGELTWQVPQGDWTIFRFGHTTTGSAPTPSPEGVKALECDKLSATSSRFHMTEVIEPLQKHLGGLVGTTFRHILFDSYEAGEATWTPALPEDFKRREGYNPIPWLPVLAGRVIASPALSERFRWDIKRTMADLFVQNNFKQAGAMIRAAGMEMRLEPYTGPFNSAEAAEAADVVMGEFWVAPIDSAKREIQAIARGLGRKIIAAEAFSSGPETSDWKEEPANLKPLGDAMLTTGYNQLVLQSWAHQPFSEKVKPGMTFGWWGLHFGPNQTWFDPGKAWVQYLSRAQAVLQHGMPVSDYCKYDFTTGNGDVISESALLQRVQVKNGLLTLPQGNQYAFLVLPDRDTMLPKVARRLKQLVAAGAVIVGPKPKQSPSMAEFPVSDKEVNTIGRELWGAIDGRKVFTNGYGKGEVIWGKTPEETLAVLNIAPDLILAPAIGEDIRYTHRREGQTDIYFIANLRDRAVRISGSFRVAGKIPEIWHPEDGTRATAGVWSQHAGRTNVELNLERAESVFVVFRRSARLEDPLTAAVGEPGGSQPVVTGDSAGRLHMRAAAGTYRLTWASGRNENMRLSSPPPSLQVDGPWEVRFPQGWGAPERVSVNRLISWTEFSDRGIKYFSGTARYAADFSITPELFKPALRIMLDLGTVKNLAEVVLNGRNIGTLWHAPFWLNVTDAIKLGSNHIEIQVTNLWPNRLIGDEQEPEDCSWGKVFDDPRTPPGAVGKPLAEFPSWFLSNQPRPSALRYTFTTWNYFRKDSPLLESGLLGPVTLRAVSDVVLPTRHNQTK
jgi:hypothetical protein